MREITLGENHSIHRAIEHQTLPERERSGFSIEYTACASLLTQPA
jgi:hypothetical protein